MKQWYAVEHLNTGEPDGLRCQECAESIPEGLKHKREITEYNYIYECGCCGKRVSDEYVVCGECLHIYPKGKDARVDSGMKCGFCAYSHGEPRQTEAA